MRWLRAVFFTAILIAIGPMLTDSLAQLSESPAPTNSLQTKEVPNMGGAVIRKNADRLSLGLNKIPVLQEEFWGNPIWVYASALAYVGMAFLMARMVDWLVQTQLKRWVSQTKSQWDDLLLNLLSGPIKIITFVVFLNVGLQLVDWPGTMEAIVSRIAYIVVLGSLLMVSLRMVDIFVRAWKSRLPVDGDRGFNEQFLVFIGQVAKVILGAVAALTLIDLFGFPIKTLLGTAGVFGLAVGLAAQDTVANLFGAVAVFIDKPFRVGDRIQVGGIDGTVEEMGLRSTTVRSLDGYLITVPNKTVGNTTVINISQRSTIKTELNFGIPYDTSSERVRIATEILLSVYKDHPQTQDVMVNFNKFADSWLNLQVVHWWRGNDGRRQLNDLHELNLKAKDKFDRAGIAFAYPTQTLLFTSLNTPVGVSSGPAIPRA